MKRRLRFKGTVGNDKCYRPGSCKLSERMHFYRSKLTKIHPKAEPPGQSRGISDDPSECRPDDTCNSVHTGDEGKAECSLLQWDGPAKDRQAAT